VGGIPLEIPQQNADNGSETPRLGLTLPGR
jgi:hypothetical protein